MCLIVNKKLCPNGYKIAKKNIPCYKVLLKTYSGRFETPCRHETVDITNGIKADEFQTKASVSVIRSDNLIHKGVHSCTNLERAYRLQNNVIYTRNLYLYVGAVVLKAYIPKGTKYWVGEGHEFCSERIIFAKE